MSLIFVREFYFSPFRTQKHRLFDVAMIVLCLVVLSLTACTPPVVNSNSAIDDQTGTAAIDSDIESEATSQIDPVTNVNETPDQTDRVAAVTETPNHADLTTADLDTNTIGVYLYPEDDIVGPAAGMMAEAGALWARSWFNWNEIEPILTDPPTYNWERTDARLLAARQAGLEPIFLLGGNARWASDSFCGPIYPEHHPAFQRFLGDAVKRYGVEPYNIRLWEIYNEPDSEFGPQGYCFGTRGAAYADTLRLAYSAIKAVDPDAVVMFGGISYDFFTNEGGRFDPAFLDDALAAGAGPYFDVLAFHYYPAFAERWAEFGSGVAGKAAYLRQELARYDLDKPLALTEIGHPTRGPEDDFMAYDELTTARFVAPALTLARASELAPIIWFTAVDKPNGPYDYGLLNAELLPEPSYSAYRAILPALQGATYIGEHPVAGPGQAHRFEQGDRMTVVAWADGGGAVLRLQVGQATVIDRLGHSEWVVDGNVEDSDNQEDGVLSLPLTLDPIVIWLDQTLETSDD